MTRKKIRKMKSSTQNQTRHLPDCICFFFFLLFFKMSILYTPHIQKLTTPLPPQPASIQMDNVLRKSGGRAIV